MSWLDAWVAACLGPLAVWLLLSGLDDLFVDLVWLGDVLRRRLGAPRDSPLPDEETLASVPQKLIAVLVPLWREHRVIVQMLERNLAACRYQRFEIFVGCYPNDEPTIAAVREVATRHPRVHLVCCPHDGPTSKADCLNWVYASMLRYEQEHNVRFEIIVTHDAEDWMHPLALSWSNYFAEHYEMVQIPVLPLPTPARRFTHGVYCDEFAEFQTKDIPARLLLGAALPSNGVGTAFRRHALDHLASLHGGCVFDPQALTEDYAAGLRLHELGYRQYFLGIKFWQGSPTATREYFPRAYRAALRQRTRWITGIALQGWKQFGWRGKLPQIYFLWRDRKGLIGNPVTLLVNAVFLYGASSWICASLSGQPWVLGQLVPWNWLLHLTLALQVWRAGLRGAMVARIYGWRFATLSPLRIFWANWINAAATLVALVRYARAGLHRRPLAWDKTEHRYPQKATLAEVRPRLGELLVRWGWMEQGELEQVLAAKPEQVRLGEYLVGLRRLSEWQVYRALSVQQNLPLERLHPREVPRRVARALPAAVVRRWKVLPFKVAHGNLFVASPELPSEEVEEELRRFTRLEIRFHLVAPSDFAELERALIETPAHSLEP